MEIQRLTISCSALWHNVEVLRKLAPQSLFLAVVKANAYGHGLEPVVRSLSGRVDWFGVNSLAEALQVRRLELGLEQKQRTPILVMGLNGSELGEYKKLKLEFGLRQNIHFVFSNKEALEEMEGLGLTGSVPFHLKVDTGLSRLGLGLSQLPDLLEYIYNQSTHDKKNLAFSGLMTHFANVEDVTDQDYACQQLQSFIQACSLAKSCFPKRKLLCHAAASAAAMVLPESRLDMIRVGISLYGLWPSVQTRLSFFGQNTGQALPELRPVLTWTSRIVHIHETPANSYVGYGCTYRSEQKMNLAVVPVGYYEGYGRDLSNRSYVLVHGHRAYLLGRVSMNMIIIDISLIKQARVGDEVTLIGRDGQNEISADQLAEMATTINYEIVTRINAELPRVLGD